ncbi:MAG TPA: 3D domain-containing protein [Spirochaetota bacterium]|nr:3D domain-containing protein [Spirochaetota bacterium]HPC43266.1 3D domain-containing protein [Spirochaetota bacterium]HPL17971.1 3D domain-containing protein [Spirochaetota bacterium]HQF10437.1 3D domain-containing protein [Spirochaetota bacterium]HQH99336.1 3D domain-containing protein [Spirochaetota bacterium]
MRTIIHDNKGALLVTAIILFYFGVVSLLQAVAFRHCRAPQAAGKAAAMETGMEMRGFTVTAYCPGSCCNGIWAGRTATGKSIDYYTGKKLNIAAVDPAVIPMGTRFAYGGREYLAVDIGGKIRGKRIDLLVLNHRATYQFGVKKNQSILIHNSRTKDTFLSGARLKGLTRVDPLTLGRTVQ